MNINILWDLIMPADSTTLITFEEFRTYAFEAFRAQEQFQLALTKVNYINQHLAGAQVIVNKYSDRINKDNEERRKILEGNANEQTVLNKYASNCSEQIGRLKQYLADNRLKREGELSTDKIIDSTISIFF